MSSSDEEEDMSSVGEEQLLKISDVAKILNVKNETIRRWIAEGALPAIILPHKLGQKRNAYRIKRSDVNKMLQSS